MNDNCSGGTCPSLSFILYMLMKIGDIKQKKINDQELRSLQYLSYHESIFLILLLLKHFKNICFAFTVKIMLCLLKFHFKQ